MIHLETILFDYFAKTRFTLDSVYDWKIPEAAQFNFERGEDSCARANIRLRRTLNKIWDIETERRLDIANWYVRVWGGIRTNKSGTIDRYVQLSEDALASSGWHGIATWSKILALRNPNKFPIYDARVSAALLALQLANGATNLVIFPQVPSRNSVIITFQRGLKHRTSKGKKPRYQDYVSLLTAVAVRSGLTSPEEVEMCLFANAEMLTESESTLGTAGLVNLDWLGQNKLLVLGSKL